MFTYVFVSLDETTRKSLNHHWKNVLPFNKRFVDDNYDVDLHDFEGFTIYGDHTNCLDQEGYVCNIDSQISIYLSNSFVYALEDLGVEIDTDDGVRVNQYFTPKCSILWDWSFFSSSGWNSNWLVKLNSKELPERKNREASW